MWPSSLIHREAGQHGPVANDVISDKSCSFWRKKSYGVFNSTDSSCLRSCPVSDRSRAVCVAAPMYAPTEVSVSTVDYESIYVKWRGVSTEQNEEPLEGYKVRCVPHGATGPAAPAQHGAAGPQGQPDMPSMGPQGHPPSTGPQGQPDSPSTGPQGQPDPPSTGPQGQSHPPSTGPHGQLDPPSTGPQGQPDPPITGPQGHPPSTGPQGHPPSTGPQGQPQPLSTGPQGHPPSTGPQCRPHSLSTGPQGFRTRASMEELSNLLIIVFHFTLIFRCTYRLKYCK